MGQKKKTAPPRGGSLGTNKCAFKSAGPGSRTTDTGAPLLLDNLIIKQAGQVVKMICGDWCETQCISRSLHACQATEMQSLPRF